MESRKIVSTLQNSRTRMLRGGEGVAFDIWVVHYAWRSSTPADAQGIVIAVSARAEDQVDDAVGLGITDIIIGSAGVHFPMLYSVELTTSGGFTLRNAYTITLPKPFRVPYLAGVMGGTWETNMARGIEVLFERVQVSTIERAQLIRESGGSGPR